MFLLSSCNKNNHTSCYQFIFSAKLHYNHQNEFIKFALKLLLFADLHSFQTNITNNIKVQTRHFAFLSYFCTEFIIPYPGKKRHE